MSTVYLRIGPFPSLSDALMPLVAPKIDEWNTQIGELVVGVKVEVHQGPGETELEWCATFDRAVSSAQEIWPPVEPPPA